MGRLKRWVCDTLNHVNNSIKAGVLSLMRKSLPQGKLSMIESWVFQNFAMASF